MRSRSNLILVIVILCAGCYRDSDVFNEQQSELLCALQSRCSGWRLVERMEGLSCEETRDHQLQSCSDACDYDDQKAEACIKALKRARKAKDCSLEDADLDVCAEVYTNCEEDEEALQCELPEPRRRTPDEGFCAVAPERSAPAVLPLLVALGLRRRRARP